MRAPGLVLALLLSACASRKVLVSPRAQLRLERPDIIELNEAFKTVAEKTITLSVARLEIECAERSCEYPVKGVAKVLRNGEAAGVETIRGTLIFTRDSTARLVEMMETARNQAKEQTRKGKLGEAVCGARHCSLDFALEARGERREVPLASIVLE